MGHLQARTLGTWPVINLGPTGASLTPTSYMLMIGWNAFCTLGLLRGPVNDSALQDHPGLDSAVNSPEMTDA
jgi:hypothetical protein